MSCYAPKPRRPRFRACSDRLGGWIIVLVHWHGLVHGLVHCEATLEQIGQTSKAGLSRSAMDYDKTEKTIIASSGKNTDKPGIKIPVEQKHPSKPAALQLVYQFDISLEFNDEQAILYCCSWPSATGSCSRTTTRRGISGTMVDPTEKPSNDH